MSKRAYWGGHNEVYKYLVIWRKIQEVVQRNLYQLQCFWLKVTEIQTQGRLHNKISLCNRNTSGRASFGVCCLYWLALWCHQGCNFFPTLCAINCRRKHVIMTSTSSCSKMATAIIGVMSRAGNVCCTLLENLCLAEFPLVSQKWAYD